MIRLIKFILTAFLFSQGCSQESSEPKFDFINYSGIWVPYEIKFQDGTVRDGPFHANSIFGVYAESVHLKEDKTFVPIAWENADRYVIKTEEAGKFEYNKSNNTLNFKEGRWNMQFEILNYSEDELHMKNIGEENIAGTDFDYAEFKLKREAKD